MLTPKDYYDRFFKISAFAEPYGMIGPFSVHRYRNLSHSSGKVETSAYEGMRLKDKIIGALRSRYKKITGKHQNGDLIVIPEASAADWFQGIGLVIQKTAIVAAFAGKGRPATISNAITCGLSTGVMNLDTIYGDLELMGLDCNGFVGGYAFERGVTGADGHLGPSTEPSTFAARGIARETWDDVRAHDILLTPGSPQHIRIVHAKYADTIEVCESASSLKGLSWRQYRVVGDAYGDTQVQGRKGEARMFKLRRSTQSGGTSDHWVLISRVGL